jgi:hypothetical protein
MTANKTPMVAEEQRPDLQRYMWLWFVIPVLVGALVVGIAVVAWPPHSQVGIGFNFRFPPPTARNWHPDTSPGAAEYCGGLSFLTGPLPDPQLVGTVINEAPTVASHSATLKFYNDLRTTITPTSQLNSDLAAV